MKTICILLAMSLYACTGKVQTNAGIDSAVAEKPIDTADKVANKDTDISAMPAAPAIKSYSNERFKDVTVVRTGDHTFTVHGKAQVFEAVFGWVVEDGHKELKRGSQMTNAGAPEWGNFTFKIDVAKERPESALTLILFESSAKDGSRQFELPVVLN